MLITQAQRGAGVMRKGSDGDRKLGRFHIALGSVLAVLRRVLSTSSAWCPSAWSFPSSSSCVSLACRAGGKGQVLISEPSVNLEWCLSLKSVFPLHLHLCN